MVPGARRFLAENILADGSSISVLDWEVAHCGDPVFDLAFLTAHLLLKAIHRPPDQAGYRSLAETFLDTYMAGVTTRLHRPGEYLAAHVACLLLARVDGKSPVEYLTDGERSQVRRLADWALTDRVPGVFTLWDHLGG
jgi:5-methylthioribose kinase